jgi:hypothetical protein
MTERELSRAAARRLAIIRHAEEVTGNVALTCRYYGISRTLFYTWRRRYEELGIEGLRPRSRRPHTSPNATSGEVIGKIVHLRKNYHFGPAKISMYLGSGSQTARRRPLAGPERVFRYPPPGRWRTDHTLDAIRKERRWAAARRSTSQAV